MRDKAKAVGLSRLDNYGRLLLTLKSRLVLPTCSIKMLATENQTNNILEQLNQVIFALKLSNTLLPMRLQFVILHQSPCLHL